MRILVMCGKGGTGKTTLAAALGLKAARAGQRTLVFSIDPAHSLAHALDRPLEHAPTALAPNLWAAELEAGEEIDANWGDVKGYVTTLLQGQGVEHQLGGELSSLPGVNEIAALIKIQQFHDSGQFDVLILDNAPTGFALRLLSLPEIFGWYAKQANRLYERHGAQLMLLAPMVGANLPMPSSDMIAKGMGLYGRLKNLPLLLADPAVTSTRLVMGPDRLSLAEAKQAYSYLSLYGLTADAVYVNGCWPADATDPLLAKRRAGQEAVLADARAAFAPLPVQALPWQAEEPIGLGAIEALADAAWPTGDPIAPQSSERALSMSWQDEQLLVGIKLPFVTPKDVDLAKFENELYITIGKHRRNLLLPREAADMQPTKAKFSEGRLLVTLTRT